MNVFEFLLSSIRYVWSIWCRGGVRAIIALLVVQQDITSNIYPPPPSFM